MTIFSRIAAILVLILSLLAANPLTAADDPAALTPPADHILLTIFLKHDQSKTLSEIQQELAASGFWKAFPPEGVGVQSWYVMMGIGQVVTLKVPPAKLREVNRAIEQTAWKAFRTEFYATYDLWPVVQAIKKKQAAK